MDLEKLKEKVNADEGFMRFNGIEVTHLEPGCCQCRARMEKNKENPHGIAHGGFLFTICDTVAGIAGTSLGRGVVGRSADIHFLRPGRGTAFTGKGRVVQAGHTTALCAVELYDDRDELIVSADFELFFLNRPAES